MGFYDCIPPLGIAIEFWFWLGVLEIVQPGFWLALMRWLQQVGNLKAVTAP